MLELLDRLGGSVHWNACRRGNAISVISENVGVVIVESAADDAAQFIVADMRREESLTRIQNGEIEPHLVETLMEQARQSRSRAVESILRRIRPEHRTRSTEFASLRRRDMVPTKVECRIPCGLVTFENFAAAHVSDVIKKGGLELHDVSIGVDYRMSNAGTYVRGSGRSFCRGTHRLPRFEFVPLCRASAFEAIKLRLRVAVHRARRNRR